MLIERRCQYDLEQCGLGNFPRVQSKTRCNSGSETREIPTVRHRTKSVKLGLFPLSCFGSPAFLHEFSGAHGV